jgi:hypothetical protein
VVVPAVLVVASLATGLDVPARAAGATGCAGRPDVEHRVLVKARPVTTRDGRRFGVLRLFGGEVFAPLGDVGGGGLVPVWCLDLVVADRFADRSPREHGRVVWGDGTSVAFFRGRAATGVVSSGGGSGLEGRRIEVTYVVEGRVIRARRVVRAVFPGVGRPRRAVQQPRS